MQGYPSFELTHCPQNDYPHFDYLSSSLFENPNLSSHPIFNVLLNLLPAVDQQNKEPHCYKKQFFVRLAEYDLQEEQFLLISSLAHAHLAPQVTVDLSSEALAKSLAEGKIQPTCQELLGIAPFCKNHLNSLTLARALEPKKLRDVDDAFIQALSALGLPLTSLNLCRTQNLTDSSLKSIGTAFPNLKHIALTSCNDAYTDEGVIFLVEHCPHLEKIDLSFCRRITNNSLIAIGSSNPHLKALLFSECTAVSQRALEVISEGCKQLCLLDLSGCRVQDEAIFALAKRTKTLEYVNLSHCPITDAALSALMESCPKLKKLEVRKCELLSQAGKQKLTDYLESNKKSLTRCN